MWFRHARARLAALVGVLGLVAGIALLPTGASAEKDGTLKNIVQGRVRRPIVTTSAGVTRALPGLSGGVLNAAATALAARSAVDTRADRAEDQDAQAGTDTAALEISANTLGCGRRTSNADARVNQDCGFRRQAEESITYNPANPANLVAGQNDERVGFNQCGIDWSLDNGERWGDQLPPFRGKLNNPDAEQPASPSDPNAHTLVGGPGTLHTYDAAADPGVAMDSRGNAYFSCVTADAFSNASMVFVTRSPAQAAGSFFFALAPFGRAYVVVEDNSPLVLHDKPFVAADKYASSPNRDNVYVAWTAFRFGPDCAGGTPDVPAPCQSPIFASMTTDQGHHWSTPEEISGASDSLCFQGNVLQSNLNPHACDLDQAPDLTVLPNGDVEVIFENLNTAPDNPDAQQLGVHCRPQGQSPTGSAHLNCAAPVKVGKVEVTAEPQCDFGRGPEECIPGAYVRTDDFPRINKNVNGNMHLYATWQDYRGGEFDIQLSQSLDGGKTWKEVGRVNPDVGRDHYFPAVEIAPRDVDNGRDDESQDRTGISYYRSNRVINESVTPAAGFACPPGSKETNSVPSRMCSARTANSDYVLAGGSGTHTPYQFKMVSPEFSPPDGNQTGFIGDYSGLTINRGTEAHPIWADTRNANPFPENGVVHDEDVFTTSTDLPR
jgi:hypothetical protein